jgi:hypothetical protein
MPNKLSCFDGYGAVLKIHDEPNKYKFMNPSNKNIAVSSSDLSGLFASLILSCMLIGCGGGGSGGGGGTTQPPASVPVTGTLALSGSTPVNGTANVSRDIAPQLFFSAGLNNATVTTANVSLTHGSGTAALGLATTGTQLIATPSQRLLPLTEYTLNIGTGLAGVNGEKLASAQKIVFTTADREWRTAKAIGPGKTTGYPCVAIDARGNAIAVWSQWDGTTYSIYANRYVAGSGWGTAQPIETGSGTALSPVVALDAAGNAIAVWTQSDGTTNSIYANRYVAGGSWGAAELIETGSGAAGESIVMLHAPVQIAVDPAGNAIAVWNQQDGTTNSIYANRYVAGNGWGTAELIETSTDVAVHPNVGIDASGNAIAVWMQRGDTTSDIYANRYVAGSGWGTAQLLNTDGGFGYYPEIAVAASGHAMVIWPQKNGTYLDVRARRYAAGSGWDATSQTIGTAKFTNMHKVAMNAGGEAFAAWIGTDGTNQIMYANRFLPASQWGTAQALGAAVNAVYPQIAVDARGNALAVWIWDDYTSNAVCANRFTRAGGWTATQLCSVVVASATRPHLSINADGDAVAVWAQWNYDPDSIYVNHFD